LNKLSRKLTNEEYLKNTNHSANFLYTTGVYDIESYSPDGIRIFISKLLAHDNDMDRICDYYEFNQEDSLKVLEKVLLVISNPEIYDNIYSNPDYAIDDLIESII
jgi:hypothetical protein